MMSELTINPSALPLPFHMLLMLMLLITVADPGIVVEGDILERLEEGSQW
jgi:hypothetical protein